MIRIVDYGMGNLRSVQKGFEKVGCPAEICAHPEEIRHADSLVLPGVGAFRDAMSELKRLDLVEPILEHIQSGRPFLGICLGLQLLFDESHEDGLWPGLGVVPGKVVRFESHPDLKIPHMGWNTLQVVGQTPLLANLPPGTHVYFVHSYHVVPTDSSWIAATTVHGQPFVSAIAKDNVVATQFHPEKSQQAGLQLLQRFAQL